MLNDRSHIALDPKADERCVEVPGGPVGGLLLAKGVLDPEIRVGTTKPPHNMMMYSRVKSWRERWLPANSTTLLVASLIPIRNMEAKYREYRQRTALETRNGSPAATNCGRAPPPAQ
jgi:hypothetical protein